MRSPGHDARASWEEILPYEALEDAALASTLPAHHGYLGQVQAEADPGAREDVLELINGVDHVLHTVLTHSILNELSLRTVIPVVKIFWPGRPLLCRWFSSD